MLKVTKVTSTAHCKQKLNTARNWNAMLHTPPTCCSSFRRQIGLKTRRFINIEDDADGGAGAAMLVRRARPAVVPPSSDTVAGGGPGHRLTGAGTTHVTRTMYDARRATPPLREATPPLRPCSTSSRSSRRRARTSTPRRDPESPFTLARAVTARVEVCIIVRGARLAALDGRA